MVAKAPSNFSQHRIILTCFAVCKLLIPLFLLLNFLTFNDVLVSSTLTLPVNIFTWKKKKPCSPGARKLARIETHDLPKTRSDVLTTEHWTKKRICLSLLVEQIYCKFRVLMLLLICPWCKFCSKVKVYFSVRVV